MNTLVRYIATEVIKGALIATLILLILVNFFTFADELGDLGKGDYGLKQILTVLVLTSPRDFYELLPSGVLVGSLVMLGALANGRELMAMQSAGVSRWGLLGAVMLAGVPLCLVSIGVGEYIAPVAERSAHALKATALKKQVAARTRYGFWVRDGRVFINIRQIEHLDALGDITIFQTNDNSELLWASHAGKALYDNDQWHLKKIRETRFDGDQARAVKKETTDWSSVLAPDLLNAFVLLPENLPAQELARYITYLRDNGQQSPIVELAFWGRITNPLLTLIMLMVAIPFVLVSGGRGGMGVGQRIVIGVVIGLGFYLFDKMFGHIGLIYEISPVVAAFGPAVLALAGALAGLSKTRSF
ncbi:MAG: LPS export ABC transporter permease LptG [Methylococcaceae bacterium]